MDLGITFKGKAFHNGVMRYIANGGPNLTQGSLITPSKDGNECANIEFGAPCFVAKNGGVSSWAKKGKTGGAVFAGIAIYSDRISAQMPPHSTSYLYGTPITVLTKGSLVYSSLHSYTNDTDNGIVTPELGASVYVHVSADTNAATENKMELVTATDISTATADNFLDINAYVSKVYTDGSFVVQFDGIQPDATTQASAWNTI